MKCKKELILRISNDLERRRQNREIYNFAIKDDKIIIEPTPRNYGKTIEYEM